MFKQSIFKSLLIVAVVTIAFYACEKTELPLTEVHTETSSNKVSFVEPSEEIINGELFIDGISQKEVITDFDIEGVNVIDGRLVFDDHEKLMNAIDNLANYNTESVVAWGKKMNFSSLFTELTRMEAMPLESIREELSRDMNNEYFYISENNTLELSKHSHVHARVFNTQGLIQVGEYVGTISPGLNIWVKADKAPKLIDALKNHKIDDKDKDFMIVDKRAFNNDYKNWVHSENCPKTGEWLGPNNSYKNPNANRRLKVRGHFSPMATPIGNGLWEADVRFLLYTESRKGSNNRYKTDHYLSLDIKSRTVNTNNNPPTLGSIATWKSTETDTNTKYGHTFVQIYSGTGTLEFISTNSQRLEETIPGSTGFTGTAGSHRGMNARYGRIDCD